MTQTTDIEKPQPFDPAAAVNAIRDKIRVQMLDVIPNEQWDALIRAEMRSFTEDRTEGVMPWWKDLVRSSGAGSVRRRTT